MPSTASIAMCNRPDPPSTGAPTSASVPDAAQASTIGANRESSTATVGASSSYPVRDSSGKTTTRAPAARMVAACVNAFVATSHGKQGGWATAMASGSRIRPPSCSVEEAVGRQGQELGEVVGEDEVVEELGGVGQATGRRPAESRQLGVTRGPVQRVVGPAAVVQM